VIRHNDHLTGKALPGAGAVRHIISDQSAPQQNGAYSISSAAVASPQVNIDVA
jgi:hypothetical protein